MLPVDQFNTFIKKNALFTRADHILLAVSGGKDSVLMAQLFKLAGYQFSIAHCNFNLRGNEAQRDEAFVKLLAASLGVPFYVAHFDTKAYAHTHHISIQMAARDLRYQWFETLRQHEQFDFIALAHHQNDAIETLLLNLVRGTGISGMHGILPKRNHLVRPLLFLSRQDIDRLVEENDLDFVTDSSNESTKYARNKIRHQVVPHLKELNPNLEDTFAQNINRFAETELLLQQVVQQLRKDLFKEKDGDIYIHIAEIKKLNPQKLLCFELLSPYHFTSSVVDEILSALDKQSGTSFYSTTHRATINRTALLISALTAQDDQLVLVHGNEELISVAGQTIRLGYTHSTEIDAGVNKAYVDADRLIFPLVIRFRQEGDRFMPLGMKQYKKLSNFLIDLKVPLPKKGAIPLLLNGNGEMIWVVGLRQDNRYKVGATTKKVAIFELLNQ